MPQAGVDITQGLDVKLETVFHEPFLVVLAADSAETHGKKSAPKCIFVLVKVPGEGRPARDWVLGRQLGREASTWEPYVPEETEILLLVR